jgi:hypothetical protein
MGECLEDVGFEPAELILHGFSNARILQYANIARYLRNGCQGEFLRFIDNKEQQQIPFGDDNKKGNDNNDSGCGADGKAPVYMQTQRRAANF